VKFRGPAVTVEQDRRSGIYLTHRFPAVWTILVGNISRDIRRNRPAFAALPIAEKRHYFTLSMSEARKLVGLSIPSAFASLSRNSHLSACSSVNPAPPQPSSLSIWWSSLRPRLLSLLLTIMVIGIFLKSDRGPFGPRVLNY